MHQLDFGRAMNNRLFMIAVAALLVAGCTHIGPRTVARDRFDYNTEIANSWKEQTLLNIVKIRYADMPLFVDVASVVSGYTVEGSVNLAGTVSSQNTVQGDFLSLGTTGKFTDRPTITYKPITGQQFNKSFMTPIPPGAILFLMQSGWPVDLIFPLTVDSMNGLRGRVLGGANARAGDPGFFRAINLLRKIQQSGAVGMRILRGDDKRDTTVMFFHRDNLAPEIAAAMRELSELLGLRSDAGEVKISYGSVPQTDSELAILTRSLLQIIIQLAIEVDVPDRHVEEGRTIASRASDPENRQARMIQIESGSQRPEDAFTAVKYRDHWFWIDDRDFHSKRTFAFLMILFSLTETGGKEGLPLVTIPSS